MSIIWAGARWEGSYPSGKVWIYCFTFFSCVSSNFIAELSISARKSPEYVSNNKNPKPLRTNFSHTEVRLKSSTSEEISYWMEQPCKYLWIDIFASCLSIPKKHKKHDEARPWLFTWPQNRLYNKTLQEFRTFISSKTVIAVLAFMTTLNFIPFLHEMSLPFFFS